MRKGLSLSQQARVIAQLAGSLAEEASTIEAARELQLSGFSEAMAILGVTKYHLNRLRRAGHLPAPVAELACGPIWRTEDLVAYVETAVAA